MQPFDSRTRSQLLMLWIIWGAILGGLGILYLAFARRPAGTEGNLAVVLAAFSALFVSIIIRWLIVPRVTSLVRLLPLFIVGLALAEGCGIIGLFLGGPYRDTLWVLGVLGVTSYVPLFARRLSEPRASGFIPNN